jgi:type VI protein secretion system component Hcp
MSEYFLMVGSPGKVQVRGLSKTRHHAGWLEIASFTWVSPRPSPSSAAGDSPSTTEHPPLELQLSRKADQVSPILMMHCANGTLFDVVVLDVWDSAAKRSKIKLHLDNVIITACQVGGGGPSAIETISINFSSMHVGGAAGPQTDGTNPAAIWFTLTRAAA